MPFENPYRSDRVPPSDTSAARKGSSSPTTSLCSYRMVILALLFVLGGCAFYYENYMGSDLQSTTSASYKLRGFATKLLHLEFQTSTENAEKKDIKSTTSNQNVIETIQKQQDVLNKMPLNGKEKIITDKGEGVIHSTTQVISPNKVASLAPASTTTTTTTTSNVQSPPLPDHMRDMALQRDGVDNKRRSASPAVGRGIVLPPPTAAPTHSTISPIDHKKLENLAPPVETIKKVPIVALSPLKPIEIVSDKKESGVVSPIEKTSPKANKATDPSSSVDKTKTGNANSVKIIRPNPYDIKNKSKKPTAAKNEKSELKKEDIKCDGTMDPFDGKPIENYVPPKSASMEKKYQWTKSVKDMLKRVKAITYGGAKLREKLEDEAHRLRMMRMELFCEDLLKDL